MAETLGQATLEVSVSGVERVRAGLQSIEQQTTKTAAVAEGLGSAFNTARNVLATFGAVQVFRDLINSATELENITRKLNNTLGDSGAQQALGFLRGLSDSLGLSFNVLADSFGSFTAAASAANIPLEEQKDLFAAVSTSAQRLGLSNDAINGSLLALQQIASKGNVQMEELRGQLGERLPTAFAAAASGLGVSNAELIKLVESGKLTAEQFFPALTKGLNELNGSGGASLPTATQNFASLGNELEKLKAGIGQELLPGVLAFTQALAGGLQGPVKSELISVNNAISFLKDAIADQTEFGLDTKEAERKLAQLQIKAEELQSKLGRINREDEIKTEALGLERQRRDLERQGVATDAVTEKIKLLSQELFLLNGSAEKVNIGQIFNGLTQDQISLTPDVTPQLREARAEQEKINDQLEIQKAARARLVFAGKDTETVDARILRLQERSQGVLAGIGVAALDRIQREKDAKIAADRAAFAEDAKLFNTQEKRENRIKELRKQNKTLDDNSSQLKDNNAEIASLEAQTDKGAKKLADAGVKIGEEIAKGAQKLEDAGKSLQKANEGLANAVASNADIATDKAIRQARQTLQGEVQRDLDSGLIDRQKLTAKFGGRFDSGERVGVGSDGVIRQQQLSPPKVDLSTLSLQELQQVASTTGALADAQASAKEAQQALTTATNELKAQLELANGRESNLAITVPVGATREVYLP
jgi:tape measure domain-containing protein